METSINNVRVELIEIEKIFMAIRVKHSCHGVVIKEDQETRLTDWTRRKYFKASATKLHVFRIILQILHHSYCDNFYCIFVSRNRLLVLLLSCHRNLCASLSELISFFHHLCVFTLRVAINALQCVVVKLFIILRWVRIYGPRSAFCSTKLFLFIDQLIPFSFMPFSFLFIVLETAIEDDDNEKRETNGRRRITERKMQCNL